MIPIRKVLCEDAGIAEKIAKNGIYSRKGAKAAKEIKEALNKQSDER